MASFELSKESAKVREASEIKELASELPEQLPSRSGHNADMAKSQLWHAIRIEMCGFGNCLG
ncbi:MAG: hypothetical protein GY747_10770 [Planctomycetes bacterium]|nr:hypothetical protein [Planctomycetota bacterium]MCP4770713.1 hypothetical protein [Planctomycetota bacterium]MCP4861428.1 hypothetical protein [Planctomycetota bacterium]